MFVSLAKQQQDESHVGVGSTRGPAGGEEGSEMMIYRIRLCAQVYAGVAGIRQKMRESMGHGHLEGDVSVNASGM